MDFQRVKQILTEPTTFFKTLKKEKGTQTAFRFYIVILAISSIFSLGISYLNPSELGFADMVVAVFVAYLFGLAFSFVSAGFLHLWIMLFGGRSTYSKTYQLFVYVATPQLLFGWIPFVGFITLIWELVLLIIATPIIHKEISQHRSLLMYLIPIAVIFIILIIAIAFGAFMFAGLQEGNLAGLASGMFV